MLFTWDTTNLCIVFPSWRVTGTLSLIVSLLAVVALTAGYEAIREVSRRYEERLEQNVREAPRKFLPSPIGGVLFGVYSAGRVWLFWVTSKPVAYAYLFTRTQRRRRTKLTPYYYGRQCRRGGREEGQDGQGCAVWRAGVLLVFHHVSLLIHVSLTRQADRSTQASVHDIQRLDHAGSGLGGILWISLVWGI